jgi:hypothetical protein
MPIVGLTADGLKIAKVTVTGPASYPAGGFAVVVPELQRILHAFVSIATSLKVDNYVHAIDFSVSGNTVTIRVYRIDVTASAPAGWTEVPAVTDISGLVLEIFAIGF